MFSFYNYYHHYYRALFHAFENIFVKFDIRDYYVFLGSWLDFILYFGFFAVEYSNWLNYNELRFFISFDYLFIDYYFWPFADIRLISLGHFLIDRCVQIHYGFLTAVLPEFSTADILFQSGISSLIRHHRAICISAACKKFPSHFIAIHLLAS